jgi:hypothetical protein
MCLRCHCHDSDPVTVSAAAANSLLVPNSAVILGISSTIAGLGVCSSSLSDAEAAEINDAKRLDEMMREKQQQEQRVVKILL